MDVVDVDWVSLINIWPNNVSYVQVQLSFEKDKVKVSHLEQNLQVKKINKEMGKVDVNKVIVHYCIQVIEGMVT